LQRSPTHSCRRCPRPPSGRNNRHGIDILCNPSRNRTSHRDRSRGITSLSDQGCADGRYNGCPPDRVHRIAGGQLNHILLLERTRPQLYIAGRCDRCRKSQSLSDTFPRDIRRRIIRKQLRCEASENEERKRAIHWQDQQRGISISASGVLSSRRLQRCSAGGRKLRGNSRWGRRGNFEGVVHSNRGSRTEYRRFHHDGTDHDLPTNDATSFATNHKSNKNSKTVAQKRGA